MAAQIKVISSMATRQILSDLMDAFHQLSPHRVVVESVGGVDAAKRVDAGEAFDLVVLASNAIDKLIASGRIRGSRSDLAKSGVAVAVRAGAPHPDIGNEDALRRAVLAARTVSYSTGPSGVALAKLFERWGIATEIADRIVQAPPGVPVGSLVAKGEVELGFQQLSELMHLEGIDVLGPLPADIQIVTLFSAGVPQTCAEPEAVGELLAFLQSPAADDTKRRNGMEPV
ncbi:substrate-binding domain-containing protein [Thauera sp. SDU_THAU2]|uniref:substrate-binding domain-containing protein n=1 Tax=Thauera sp. SDU_THAU2 TaxID=3136633 RepID=UPI0031203FB1